MASINDYKLLAIKCEKYYEELSKQTYISANNDVEKSRLGFYFFILDSLCSVSEPDLVLDMITDTDFNEKLGSRKVDDCGIDAVFIDETENIINLFNFKYRNKFKVDSRQKLNDVVNSTKYINAVYSGDVDDLEGKPKKFAKKIKNLYDSKAIWKTRLYIVSNDSDSVDLNDKHIRNLTKSYDIEINSICLKDIADMLSIRPDPINATLLLPKEALMSYSENNLSTSKSYIARLTSSEIVRITCNDSSLREKFHIEEDEVSSELSDVNLDFGVLFDNVRGFVQKSKYNGNIAKTLKSQPSKFFMYNNGITIVAKNIKSQSVNGQSQLKLSIKDFQVLNGGQTVRTIHNFNQENERNIIDYLCKSEVLVRIFMSDDDEGEINKIAEYTNSQNTIAASDLKALNQKQIQIEKYLKEKGVNYVRKSGDLGRVDENYEYSIGMVKFAQILYAMQGNPEKSTNSKQSIFGKLYDDIFSSENFDIEDSYKIVEDYYNIREEYQRKDYKSIDIKHYYIMYLNEEFPNISTQDKMGMLERHIAHYKVDKETSDVRKMSQTRFKDELVDKLKQNN
ncbi:AIPR family protein [uncultured Vibrio sp.]|uniref:AIPR family protein n=1 Tax=uncultured Vibrio sp. TaxID=114054 RepID=UPI0025F7BE19|nr:AIPR family protein [uncultured Vibrio sp.]